VYYLTYNYEEVGVLTELIWDGGKFTQGLSDFALKDGKFI